MQDVECGVGDVLLYLVMAPLSLSLSIGWTLHDDTDSSECHCHESSPPELRI